jgi:hypothetical protein
MAWGRVKSEHGGPKRGKGYWGRKADAKQASERSRRREARLSACSDRAEGSSSTFGDSDPQPR